MLTQFEKTLDSALEPLKPFIPAIARTLLVSTFIEDTLRIVSQWSNQVFYLTHTRKFPWLTAEIFLLLNVVAMVVASSAAILKKQTLAAVIALVVVVISQAIGYGLLFDPTFFLRNLSIIGGLLILLADALKKKHTIFAGKFSF